MHETEFPPHARPGGTRSHRVGVRDDPPSHVSGLLGETGCCGARSVCRPRLARLSHRSVPPPEILTATSGKLGAQLIRAAELQLLPVGPASGRSPRERTVVEVVANRRRPGPSPHRRARAPRNQRATNPAPSKFPSRRPRPAWLAGAAPFLSAAQLDRGRT